MCVWGGGVGKESECVRECMCTLVCGKEEAKQEIQEYVYASMCRCVYICKTYKTSVL